MTDKLPWFPFYLNDWETNHRVRAMGPVARSYYLILLMVQWREGQIPESRSTLLRVLTLPRDPLVSVPSFPPGSGTDDDMDLLDYEAILDQVLECFDPDGNGGLVNGRLKSIRDEQLRVMEAKSRGGKHSSKNLKRQLQDSSKTDGERESQTQMQSKSQKKGESPRSKYTQNDWDERDLRKFSDAREKVELKLANGWGQDMTDEQIFEYQAILAGKTAKSMREVLERLGVTA